MTTIRRRLLLTLLPALAILMLLGGVVDYWVAVGTTARAYDRALASSALALESNIRIENGRMIFGYASDSGIPASAGLAQFDATIADSPMLYSVTGPGHQWIAGTPQFPATPLASTRAVNGVTFWDLDFQGLKWRVASVVLSTSAGPAHLSVAESSGRRSRTQRVMLFGKLLIDFAELDLTLLLIWIAIYYGLRPLDQLTQSVEQRRPLEMQPFDVKQVPGELRSVIIAFNRMLELLQHAAQAQQRFVADAAHQMRTPVAGLLAQMELLLKEPRASAIAPQVRTLQHGIQQLARSANQLLALARAEPVSGMHEKFQAVALKPLVEQLVERHIERADKAGIDFGADAREATATGDAWLLEDLLENLIDNALKYTPAGGHVTVRSGMSENQAFLEVEDDGPGIPEAERQRVRERFYRRPGSPGIGCGLGLSIVDQIARAHRAKFSIGTGLSGRGALMKVDFGISAGGIQL